MAEYRLNVKNNVDELTRDLKQAGRTADRVARRDVKRLDREFNKVGDTVRKIGSFLKRAFAVFLVGGAIYQGIRRTIELAGEIDELAKTARALGFPIEEFQALRTVARQSGIDVGTFNDSMATLTERINDAANGAGAGKEVFDQYGISVRDANGNIKSTSQVVDELSDAWRGNSNATQVAGESVKLFGSEGVGFVTFLGQGSSALETATQRARDFGAVIEEETTKKMEDATDAIGVASDVIKAQFGEAISDILPLIVSLVRGIASAVTELRKFVDLFDRISTDEEGETTSTTSLENRAAGLRRQRDAAAASNRNAGQGSQLQGVGFSRRQQAELDRIERILAERYDEERKAAQSANNLSSDTAKTSQATKDRQLEEQLYARHLKTIREGEINDRARQRAQATTSGFGTGDDDEELGILEDELDSQGQLNQEGRRRTANATGTNPFSQNDGVLSRLQSVGQDAFPSTEELAESYFSNLEDSFAKAIRAGDLGELGNSFKDSLEKTLTDASDQAFNVLSQRLAKLAVDAIKNLVLSGSGGGAGFNQGGYVRGPGNNVSDSIPARLSNGEFVVNARATRRNRGVLQAINSGGTAGGASSVVNNNNTYNLPIQDISSSIRSGVFDLIDEIEGSVTARQRERGL